MPRNDIAPRVGDTHDLINTSATSGVCRSAAAVSVRRKTFPTSDNSILLLVRLVECSSDLLNVIVCRF